jgi:hypothetical protein
MKQHLLKTAALSAALVASNAFAVDWSDRADRACRDARLSETECSGQVATVRGAMDAARRAYSTKDDSGSLATAASAVAAYVILERLHPDLQPGFEAELAVALSHFPESQAKADALAAGRRAGESILARR